MKSIELYSSKTTNPDFGGFGFFVESGKSFDAQEYANAYGLNCSDIEPQDIEAIQGAAATLSDGEWLEVTHEIDEI